MPFDSVEKSGLLNDLAAIATRITAIEPVDALQLALAQAQQEVIALGITVDNQALRITNAGTAIETAQAALVQAASALAGTP